MFLNDDFLIRAPGERLWGFRNDRNHMSAGQTHKTDETRSI